MVTNLQTISRYKRRTTKWSLEEAGAGMIPGQRNGNALGEEGE